MIDNLFDYKDSKLKIDKKYSSLCIEDVELEQQETGFEDGELKEFIGVAVSARKITFMLWAFIFGLLILGSRVFWLQLIKGDYYSSIAEGNRIRTQSIKARRGIIYDRNLNALVANVPSFSLKIIQSDLPKQEDAKNKLLGELGKLIGESVEKINALLNKGNDYYYQPIIIKENISYDKAMMLYIKSIDMPGIVLEEVSRREYVVNDNLNSLSHILGYNGKISIDELEKNKNKEYFLDDYIGKVGVELSYEDTLRGKAGKSQIETNALGKQIRIIAQKDPEPGDDLVLSIDEEFQKYIENLLKEELKKINRTRAAVVVMDPRSGEIMSMVSVPSFNNNLFVSGISNERYMELTNNKDMPLFNRVIAGTYPPGSTFKPILAGVALDEGIITKDTKIHSVGGIRIGEWFFPDWRAGGHGMVNVKNALANSVNTFFYYIGGGYQDFKGLGIDKIVEKIKLFSLGGKTNLDLPGEEEGVVPDRLWKEEEFGEPWYIGDTYHLSIGQGYLLVTPLQVSLYTSFFANGGKLYQPRVSKAIISHPNNQRQEVVSKYLSKDILKSESVKIVKEGMRDTVIYGSAKRLSDLPFSSAGKTGTAQSSKTKDPHAWFTCFAPYENPEITITIIIEEGGEGSTVSVPIAKEILKYWWEHIK